MANVLPKEALRILHKNYRARFVLVGSSVVGVCAAIALLALAPTYVLLRVERTAAASGIEDKVSLSVETDREVLAQAQILASELEPFASSTASALPIIKAILEARPAGVTVSNISFSRREEVTIVIRGTTPSREEINEYRTTLAQDTRYENVSVPLGTLAGSEDGSFSLTITGAF